MATKSLTGKEKAVPAADRLHPERDVEWIEPDSLWLDSENPRLAGENFKVTDQELIIEWLWKNKSVAEIAESILASGFWQHEELFAARENNRLVIIEGNRRLAAIQIILDPELQARLKVRYEPSGTVLETLQQLPVFIDSREDVWRFVGFKHVNGPQEWDSIAKAQYIHRVRQEYGVSLREIARSIGDEHDTVARLYRGYMVLKQAEEELDFEISDSYNRKFPFSHLWTALGYTAVQKYLGITSSRDEKSHLVPKSKLRQLGTFMNWLFGSRQREEEPVVKRQNPDLRELANALQSPKGIQMLEARLPLAAAIEASKGDVVLFREALLKTEADLREAKRYVATGYSGEVHLLETVAQIVTISLSLRKEMLSWTASEGDDE